MRNSAWPLILLASACLLLATVSRGTAQDDKPNPCAKAEGLTPEAAEKLLAEHRKQLSDSAALTLEEVLRCYNQCSEHIKTEGFKELRGDWSKELATKAAASGTADELASVALQLDDDDYNDLARPLLEQAWKALKAAGLAALVATEERNGRTFKVMKANPKFVDVVTRLGWKPYARPAAMDDCHRLEVEGAADYNAEYVDIDTTFHDVGLYPPGLVEKLTALEKVALEGLAALQAQDEKDGFAIAARGAWIRFRNANDNNAKVDRSKGKRSFSPRAMGREKEPFRDIWMYYYCKPFVVYMEKPGCAKISAGQIDGAMNLLCQLHQWFSENLITPWELRRAKPADNNEQAEREGWPLEIVLFAEKSSFDQYMRETWGQAIPGARSTYSPLEERLVVCLPEADDAATLDYHRPTLVYNAFLFLSDIYAAGPQFSAEQMQQRPRYSSVLVHEGLADFACGMSKRGTGADTAYTFGGLNTLRLKDFKSVYETLGNKQMFRLRDLPDCRNYRQCAERALERLQAGAFKVNAMAVKQIAVSTYYATACNACYFFHHFKKDGKYAYRDKWWAFLKDEYQGKHILKSYDDTGGFDAFKKAFEIEEDADWDTIEAEFLEFTLALKAPD